ncbi:putative receptor-like protein kinase At4g00960 isoform X2 [Momordica charantia]|uniref:Receptor-like protein kinase At4g00960 isoform X2 n=1 Tax=Momordica charantia TaxID=3673 RepID=A0A6J1CK26_MOMCH|nr:putative receptor-like protein kinase At4g00960 isoform X2 [Momordica charantia]
MEMGTSKNPLFLCFILIFMVSSTISQVEVVTHLCSNRGNYTSDSVYKQNLATALSSIVSDTQIDYGFYNFTAGQEPDKVHAVALCLGVVSVEKCRSCLNASTRRILEDCPNQKEAIGWYTDCMIRYSNRTIFGVRNDRVLEPVFISGQNASDIDGYTQSLSDLLQRLRNEAASGDSRRKSAVGEIGAPKLGTIFGHLQCTPDLSSVDCNNCLVTAADRVPTGSTGTRIFLTSCYLRYENRLFYDPSPPPPPPAGGVPSPPLSPPPTPDNNSNTARTVIIVVVSIVSAIILVVGIFIILRLRKRKHKTPEEKFDGVSFGDTTGEISSVETIQYDFDTIKVATNDFSTENKLGQGGFGAVYRGKLPNGQQIAVKRLANNSQQGDLEFKNEVLLVVKLQHRNLVRLLGFCLQKTERLLIYEFVPNASLDHFIFDFEKRSQLDWDRRFKIINGIARGMLYLHEDSRLRIVHRDLKASNILLDEEMNPKIADFGMARLFEVDETQGNTSRIVGTYGYMAPEYLMHGQFSVKSDVFSFGVLVLEIVSGQKNNCFRNGEKVEDLSSCAWKNWRAGTTTNVIDQTLSVGSKIEMMRCIHIGLLCVQENAADRPTMASVVLMLSSFSLTLPVPAEPAFFMHSNIDESNTLPKSDLWLETIQSSHYENTPVQALKNDPSISELHPR